MINKLWEEFKQEVEVDIQSLVPRDKLQPAFWNRKMRLKEPVRRKLIQIARDFFESLNLPPKVKLKDVTITGSLAAYNWSKYSDVDLHLILDFEDIDENEDLVKEYLGGKIFVWNMKHNIKMDDHEVEIYVQNEKEPHIANGVYSVTKNNWIKKPVRADFEIDLSTTQKKTDRMIDQIERVYDLFELKEYPKSLNSARKLKDRIKEMRQSGLSSGGIYSPENLTFKMLRRTRYLELLYDLMNKSYDRIMSLHKDVQGSLKVMIGNLEEEVNETFDRIIEERNFQRRVKQKHYLKKKWLIGFGKQKNVPPFVKKPSYKRSKSAPAGYGGS
tara:strand:+ start:1800 stop:2786 length:987 start_codon:yes stop_codon:yes gene_type:complete